MSVIRGCSIAFYTIVCPCLLSVYVGRDIMHHVQIVTVGTVSCRKLFLNRTETYPSAIFEDFDCLCQCDEPRPPFPVAPFTIGILESSKQSRLARQDV